MDHYHQQQEILRDVQGLPIEVESLQSSSSSVSEEAGGYSPPQSLDRQHEAVRNHLRQSLSHHLGHVNGHGMHTHGSEPHIASLRSRFEHLTRRTRRLNAETLNAATEKPWLDDKAQKRTNRRPYWVLLATILLSVAGAAALVAIGVFTSMPKHKYCLVLDEQFDGSALNPDVWQHEMETGGFGNGEFEWTTDSTNNSYIEDGTLYIVPTLTSDALGEEAIVNGHTLNLTQAGTCTAVNKTDAWCAAASNTTKGTILPPVQSARLRTKRTLKYGKVEVEARMPTGDWIWPAIWMMPNNSVYGDWPKSGEIDIVESKGNPATQRSDQLANSVRSSLHWGASADTDRWYMTTAIRTLYRSFYNQEYHTFGLQWTPEQLFTWEGTPVRHILTHGFKQSFYQWGQIPTTSWNGTALFDPWSGSPNPSIAPFDQDFYLILNVAVGGINGYFEDGQNDGKPWSNQAMNPRADFWAQRARWLPTWPTDKKERGMAVRSVKIWEMC